MSVFQKAFLKGLVLVVVWLWFFSGYWPIRFDGREMTDTHEVLFGLHAVSQAIFFAGPGVVIYCFMSYWDEKKSETKQKKVGFLSPFALAWLVTFGLMTKGFTSFRVLATLLVIGAFGFIFVCTFKLLFPKKRSDSMQTS